MCEEKRYMTLLVEWKMVKIQVKVNNVMRNQIFVEEAYNGWIINMQDKLCFRLMSTLGKVNLQRRLCRNFGSQIIIISLNFFCQDS
jgi:hypothetical protein